MISAVESVEQQRSLDAELEGVTYFSGGIPQAWESPSQRERETMKSLFGDNNEKVRHPNSSANSATGDPHPFSYYRAQSHRSWSGLTSPTSNSKPKVDATSQPYHRSSSDGIGSRPHIHPHRSIPPPPPPGRKKSSTAPAQSDRQPTVRDDIFANMINQAERLSSNRSIDAPSVLETPHDDQYWQNVRGKANRRSQMKGKDHSIKTKRDPIDAPSIDGDLEATKDQRLLASQRRKIEHEKQKQMRLDEKMKEESSASCPILNSNIDAYDIDGELSDAGASQVSRRSRNSNASKDRRNTSKKGKRHKTHQKKRGLNQSSQSLDRHHLRRKSLQNNRKRSNALKSSETKKVGIFAYLKGKKERYAKGSDSNNHRLSMQSMFETTSIASNRSGRSKSSRRSCRSAGKKERHAKGSDSHNHRLSIQSMFETMSIASNRSGRSKSSRRSCRSASSRRTQDSKYSQTSKRSVRSSRKANKDNTCKNDLEHVSAAKSTSSGRVPILSAAAEMFQRKSIPGNISKALSYDSAVSCSSSLSSDCDSDTSSVLIPMASVADAVEHFNSQNKIEQFVSKVKKLI